MQSRLGHDWKTESQESVTPKNELTMIHNRKVMMSRAKKHKLVEESAISAIQLNPVASIVDQDFTEKPTPRDWNAIARDFIRNQFVEYLRRNELKEKLSTKAPTIMFCLSQADVRQVAPDNTDRVQFAKTENKSSSVGVNLRKSCVVDLKNITADILSGKDKTGLTVPLNCDR